MIFVPVIVSVLLFSSVLSLSALASDDRDDHREFLQERDRHIRLLEIKAACLRQTRNWDQWEKCHKDEEKREKQERLEELQEQKKELEEEILELQQSSDSH